MSPSAPPARRPATPPPGRRSRARPSRCTATNGTTHRKYQRWTTGLRATVAAVTSASARTAWRGSPTGRRSSAHPAIPTAPTWATRRTTPRKAASGVPSPTHAATRSSQPPTSVGSDSGVFTVPGTPRAPIHPTPSPHTTPGPTRARTATAATRSAVPHPREETRRRRGEQDHGDADQSAGQLHPGGQPAEDGARRPPVVAGDDERGGHQAHHEQVVVQPGDAVGDHQRGGQHQARGERRVGAAPPRQPRHRPRQQHQPDQRHHPVRDDQQPRVGGEARGEVAADQRDRAVRRRRAHPARVDALDDRAGDRARADQHPRPVLVGRDAAVGERALGGVRPAVAGEQRRGQQERQRPGDGRARAPWRGRPSARPPRCARPPAQAQPRRRQQAEPEEHHDETGHPAGRGAAEQLQEVDVRHHGALGQGRDDQPAEQDQHAADDSPCDHVADRRARLATATRPRGEQRPTPRPRAPSPFRAVLG